MLFCIEAKFTLAELGKTRKYPREDLGAYLKRFHETELGCRDPVAEDVLVDVNLHDMIEGFSSTSQEFVFCVRN